MDSLCSGSQSVFVEEAERAFLALIQPRLLSGAAGMPEAQTKPAKEVCMFNETIHKTST